MLAVHLYLNCDLFYDRKLRLVPIFVVSIVSQPCQVLPEAQTSNYKGRSVCIQSEQFHRVKSDTRCFCSMRVEVFLYDAFHGILNAQN
jgi:hypothetical protein